MSTSLSKRAPLIAAIVLILDLRPYFTWSFIENSLVKYVFLLVLTFLFFANKKKIITKDVTPIVVFLLATFCYCFFGIICGRFNFNGFLSSLTLFLLISLPLCNKNFGVSVFDRFSTLFSIVVGISLVSWVIHQTFGLPQLGTLELLGQHRMYAHYPFFVIEITDFVSLDILRFSGPFDELYCRIDFFFFVFLYCFLRLSSVL